MFATTIGGIRRDLGLSWRGTGCVIVCVHEHLDDTKYNEPDIPEQDAKDDHCRMRADVDDEQGDLDEFAQLIRECPRIRVR
jgi:hypothetical protein